MNIYKKLKISTLTWAAVVALTSTLPDAYAIGVNVGTGVNANVNTGVNTNVNSNTNVRGRAVDNVDTGIRGGIRSDVESSSDNNTRDERYERRMRNDRDSVGVRSRTDTDLNVDTGRTRLQGTTRGYLSGGVGN